MISRKRTAFDEQPRRHDKNDTAAHHRHHKSEDTRLDAQNLIVDRGCLFHRCPVKWFREFRERFGVRFFVAKKALW